jgi:hypothetical protein
VPSLRSPPESTARQPSRFGPALTVLQSASTRLSFDLRTRTMSRSLVLRGLRVQMHCIRRVSSGCPVPMGLWHTVRPTGLAIPTDIPHVHGRCGLSNHRLSPIRREAAHANVDESFGRRSALSGDREGLRIASCDVL